MGNKISIQGSIFDLNKRFRIHIPLPMEAAFFPQALIFIIIFSYIRFPQTTTGWICCMPCVWLRTSATVHKIAIYLATIIVTALLVASPVLFLLSTAPSQLPKDCNTKSDVNCVSPRSASPTPECNAIACRQATISILARSNWKVDPCKDFTGASCGKGNAKAIRSVQEGVDALMQRKCSYLLSFNHRKKEVQSPITLCPRFIV